MTDDSEEGKTSEAGCEGAAAGAEEAGAEAGAADGATADVSLAAVAFDTWPDDCLPCLLWLVAPAHSEVRGLLCSQVQRRRRKGETGEQDSDNKSQ